MYRHTMSKIATCGASLALVLGTVLVAAAPAAAGKPPVVTTPAGFQAEVEASSVTVTWEPSSSRKGEVVIYIAKAAGRWFTTTEPTLTFFLARNTTYRLEVRAQDNLGNRSEWSEPFFFTTPEEFPVTTPGNVRVTTSPGTATVEWDESRSDAGMLDYLLSGTGGTIGRFGGRTVETSFTFDLPAGGDFQVTVRGRDQAYRYSDRSEPVRFTVDPVEGFSPPTAPENLELQFDSRGRSQLATWDASQGTGPITYHFQIDGQEVDSTRELELEVFDFVRCGEFTSPPMDVTVIATAHGLESPQSNPVEVCF